MQSKSISKTLLNNSQIAGVSLNHYDLNLSDIGHGLYIESISGDRYIDLRLAAERPFWGHTHPLMVQRAFENLSNIQLISSLSVHSSAQKSHHLTDYQTLKPDELTSNLTNLKLHLVLDETIVLDGLDLNLLEQLSRDNELLIEEQNLLLFCDSNLFYTHDIAGPKILNLTFLDHILIEQNGINSTTDFEDQNYQLLSAAVRYLNYILLGKQGKFKVDREAISKFFKEQDFKILNHGNYLIIPDTSLKAEDFIQQGIYVSNLNFNSKGCHLAIPVSCTNDELLDTLKRISRVLKR